MRQKLLVVTSSFSRDSFVRQLALRCRSGLDVTVIAPRGGDESSPGDELRIVWHEQLPFGLAGIAHGGGILSNLRRNKLLALGLPFYFLHLLLAIKRAARETGAKKIHAHWLVPGAFAAAAYKRLFAPDTKILATAHGSDVFQLTGKLSGAALRFTLDHADCLTVVSTHLAEAVRAMGYRGRLEILPMGVDTDLFKPGGRRANPEPLVAFAGRLNQAKGAHLLLDAFASLPERNRAASLLIAGDGEQKPALERQASELGIAGQVKFLGAVTHQELAGLFSKADILVNPSLADEGFGLVNTEAMSCGCIPLVANYPAAHDIIEDGINGYLFQRGDEKALALKLGEILDGLAELDPVRQAAERTVRERFDWDRVSDNCQRIIREL